jgi:Uma2 family endonuclease
MYQNHPQIDALPTMDDLPSEDPEDLDVTEAERAFYEPRPPAETMPTMYDLPSEDPEEPGLPDEFHDFQPDLLRETCLPPSIDEYFVGVDLNLYYDAKHTRWYKRPDWFLVLGVPASQAQQDLRLSYVMWQEGTAPFLMVELLSPGTEGEDLGKTLRVVGKPPTKWQVYEQMLRVPYYAVFDRYSNHFRMFQLQGSQYTEQLVTDQRFWLSALELGLGVWTGNYAGVEGQWLRWYDWAGNWIPTEQERRINAEQLASTARAEADTARAEADTAKAEAERERQRAELLATKLQELGITLD